MKIFLFIGLIIITAGCQTSIVTHGIPNLAEVEPGIWRGGQPTNEGWKWLKNQGVIYDVKLNTWKEASDDGAFANDIFVQDDGIITFLEQITILNGYAIDCAVQSLINKSDHDKIFIHCQHGQDRTGLIVAIYRVRSGWTKADAEKEMLEHGFHKELIGLWNYWRNY